MAATTATVPPQDSTKDASHPSKPSAETSSASASATGPKNYREMFDARAAQAAHTKFTDPCEVPRQQSMKCLDKNNYNRDACTEFFRNYRECKKTWLDQRREDRRNGLDASG
ncbi:hypothetical protein P389DRAFT_193844 [Cystobasidium minutum MCA 4210]|uniref:uncharacterized protein n=1 Tax=Cystobasidium minutum MCA 4210 TaxID=1397322 RepID=UPI0034CF1B69|eukprot:jgi/Rhomi1/193844/gm1.2058_g